MKKFTSFTTTTSNTVSAYNNDIAANIRKDIKNGVGYLTLLTKYPGYEDLVDFYWERL